MKHNKQVFTSDHLKRLRVANKSEQAAFVRLFMERQGNLGGHLVRITNELGPATLFKYLLARFDDPQGWFNDLLVPQDKGICWHYVLMLDDKFVEFTGFNYRIDVVFDPGLQIECSASDFAEVIKADLRAKEKQLGQVSDRLRKHIAFLNPYSHLLHTGESMLLRAAELDQRLAPSRKHPDDVQELKSQLNNHAQACADASELAGICLTLRMIAPVMAETFINIVIFKFSKPNLRSNNFQRTPIHERVAGLHLQCEGFRRPVDLDSPSFKSFHRMMVGRNDLLHGNIIPDAQPEKEFLYTYAHPNGAVVNLYHEWKSMYDRSIGSRLAAHPLSKSQTEFQAAKDFVEYLLDCMEVETKEEFEASIKYINLHYDKRAHVLTALHGDDWVDSLPADLYAQMGGGQAPFSSEG